MVFPPASIRRLGVAMSALVPPECSARDGEIVIALWLEDLIRKYHAETSIPSHSRRLVVMAAVLAMTGAALSPALLHRDRAAYPSEPDKQQALELCSRADPTFVRFLASERAACYEHFPGLAARTAASSRSP